MIMHLLLAFYTFYYLFIYYYYYFCFLYFLKAVYLRGLSGFLKDTVFDYVDVMYGFESLPVDECLACF